MPYSRNPLKKTGTLFLLNILLVLLLLGVLHSLNIVDFTGLFKHIPFIGDKTRYQPGQRIEDPNLLEREELQKHWAILNLREQLYQKRLIELKNKDREATAKFEQVEQQRREVEERIKALQQRQISEESRVQNIRYLSDKFANMPPDDTIKILVNMDNILIIDVLKQMDKDAETEGRQSITSFLLSLMAQKNANKAAELSRLISRYPTDADARRNTEPEGTEVPQQQQQTQPQTDGGQ